MIDLNTPIWKLTVGELIEVINQVTPKPEVKSIVVDADLALKLYSEK